MGGLFSRILFQPPQPTYTLDGQDLVWLQTRLGECIPMIFLPCPRAKWTILFSHANSEDIGFVYEWEELVFHLRVNVAMYDYTGYGLSSGTPSEEAVYADIEAVHQYLTTTLKIPQDTIVVYGRSLGSGPSVELASQRDDQGALKCRGVIIQSGFSSAFRVASQFFMGLATIRGDRFCNIDKVSQVGCPIFIIHGTRDTLVYKQHGEAMAEKAKHKYDPLWIEDGSHNNLEIYWKGTLISNIRDFLLHLARWTPDSSKNEEVGASSGL